MTRDSDTSQHLPDPYVLPPAGNADLDLLATAEIQQVRGNTRICVTHDNGVPAVNGRKECTYDTELYASWAVQTSHIRGGREAAAQRGAGPRAGPAIASFASTSNNARKPASRHVPRGGDTARRGTLPCGVLERLMVSIPLS